MRVAMWIISAIALIFVIIIFEFNWAEADDVYNFYFQKAPGPTTVIQGGNAAKDVVKDAAPAPVGATKDAVAAPPAPAAAAPAVVAQAPADKETKDNVRHWQVFVGSAQVQNELGGSFTPGIAIGLGYNINQYIGFSSTLTSSEGPADDQTGATAPNLIEGSVGIVITPFGLHLFGYDVVDFSLLAGLMTTHQYGFGQSDYRMSDPNSVQTTIVPYFGGGLSMNFGKAFAIVGEYKTDGHQNALASAGFAYKF